MRHVHVKKCGPTPNQMILWLGIQWDLDPDLAMFVHDDRTHAYDQNQLTNIVGELSMHA